MLSVVEVELLLLSRLRCRSAVVEENNFLQWLTVGFDQLVEESDRDKTNVLLSEVDAVESTAWEEDRASDVDGGVRRLSASTVSVVH